jgi:hypothetical protein
MMLAYLAWTLAIMGYVDQARSRLDEALSEARRLGHVNTLADCADFRKRHRQHPGIAGVAGARRRNAGAFGRARLAAAFGLGNRVSRRGTGSRAESARRDSHRSPRR